MSYTKLDTALDLLSAFRRDLEEAERLGYADTALLDRAGSLVSAVASADDEIATRDADGYYQRAMRLKARS